ARERVEGRRPAGAGRAGQPDPLAGADREVDAADDGRVAVALHQALRGERGHGGDAPSCLSFRSPASSETAAAPRTCTRSAARSISITSPLMRLWPSWTSASPSQVRISLVR